MAKRAPAARATKQRRIPTTAGAVALREWLSSHPESTQQTIADSLGVRQSTVSKWLGSSRPETPVALELEKLTAITPMAWWEPAHPVRQRVTIPSARSTQPGIGPSPTSLPFSGRR